MTTYRLPDGAEIASLDVNGGPGNQAWITHPTLDQILIDRNKLTEVKPPLPPEPKPWAVVSDKHAGVWQRIGTGSAQWRSTDGRGTDWDHLVVSLGPLTRLVTDPADDAPELPLTINSDHPAYPIILSAADKLNVEISDAAMVGLDPAGARQLAAAAWAWAAREVEQEASKP